MKKQNKTIWIIVGILALIVLTQFKPPEIFSVMYQGQNYSGHLSNKTGECWTMGLDTCVRQEVKLINLTTQNLLICPETYFPTKIDCEKAYGLVKTITKPEKITCYKIEEKKCKVVGEYETCPADTFSSLSKCQEEAGKLTWTYNLKQLIKKPYTIILLVLGVIAGIVLLIKRK